MRTEYFVIFLPFAATAVNVIAVVFLFSNNDHILVHGQHQPPADHRRVIIDHAFVSLGNEEADFHLKKDRAEDVGETVGTGRVISKNSSYKSYIVSSSGILADFNSSITNPLQDWNQKNSLTAAARESFDLSLNIVDDHNHNLKLMPKYNFKAYVRADISSYYQEVAGARTELKPSFTGQGGKFINMSPEKITLWWVDANGKPLLNGDVNPWGAGGTSTFPGHTFIFTQYQQPDRKLCTFRIKGGISVYYYDPFNNTEHHNRSSSVYKYSLPATVETTNVQNLDSLSDFERQIYDLHVLNLEFGDDYQEFTGGSPWLTMYPPNKVLHKIWPADYFGQTHSINTTETHFHSIPTELSTNNNQRRKLTLSEMKNAASALSKHRSQGTLNLTIKALSCTPKAFEIRNFLSDTEVDHILGIVNRTELQRSTTNGHVSTTRTSRTTWIPRETDVIINSIFRRVADVVQLDEALLRDRLKGEVPSVKQLNKINEQLQIVHYDKSQQYTAHHDFGYPKGVSTVDRISRSMNLAIYLNDVEEGGKTSFPRYRNAETHGSIDVQPEKGKALLFYMVNPDGNLEDMSQHAALPVIQGEKFFANLWMSTYQ